jgi:hypothetical protein
MTIGTHIDTFFGLPVVGYQQGAGSREDPEAVAWRVSVDWDTKDTFEQRFEALLGEVGADRIRALVIGDWGGAHENPAPIDLLVHAAERLVNLQALFLGEMTFEESEISWILLGDITPLFAAYPRLKALRVRGSQGLQLTPVRHAALRELAFESGALPRQVVRTVGACELPALQHLELWLGTSEYGDIAQIDDLAGVLSGENAPQLLHLGLRNAELADEVAAAVVASPVLANLEQLDLSLGTLSDAGAEALLTGSLGHLRRLNLSHHYLSIQMMERLAAALPGVDVDLSDPKEADETDDYDRYVSVSE